MRANDAVDVIAAFTAAGVDVWVEGGWGVDALVGAEGRPHKDLDLVVPLADAETVVQLLRARGFRYATGPRPSGLYRDDDGRGVDIRAVAFDASGRGVYRAPGGTEDVYPADWLQGTGTISGVAVRCLTPEGQMALHAGYQPSDKDAHDVRLLHATFGLPLPAGYEAPS
jgi:lincosamide nucleotidyltransferase A/C/D/E